MDDILRFIGGMVICVIYVLLALALVNSVPILADELGMACLVAVVAGWIALSVLAFWKKQPWIGFGILAAPFAIALVATVGCFAVLTVSSASAAG